MFKSFISQHQLTERFIEQAEANFVPLAEKIIGQYKTQQKGPFCVAINGCQGSGKSTLSEFIHDYIQHHTDLKVVVLSLDDFYFSKQTRSELAENIHPLLKTRGVPGTHNTQHIQQLLEQLTAVEGTVSLPRFNKATDNPHPEKAWPTVDLPIDIIIFEGWCWGVLAQDKQALINPVNTLEQQFDPDMRWRTFVNNTLLNDYQPLYAKMDFWVQLKAPSFECVYQWRLEQEKKLQHKTQGKENAGVMSEHQVLQFIQYYQRLTEHCLASLATRCDVVFHLGADREIIKTSNKYDGETK